MNASQNCIELIKSFEGFRARKYICPAGYSTIGYGHVLRRQSSIEYITEDEAEILLKKDIGFAVQSVLHLTKVILLQNQLDALVSFCFNLGGGAYQRSTLRSKVNRGEHDQVPQEFMKWVYVKGVAFKGLIKRRHAEAKMYS